MDDPASQLRQPPHSLRAERATLGSVMLDNTVLPAVATILSPDDFYDAGHRAIFKAMLEMDEAGKSIDPMTILDTLDVSGKLEEVGGPAYIATLESFVLSPQLAEEHANVVKDKSVKRELIRTAGVIADSAFEEAGGGEELAGQARDAVARIENGCAARRYSWDFLDLTHECFEAIQNRRNNPDAADGVPTPYSGLNQIIGHLGNSHLIVIGGRTSMGKTAFATNIASYVAGVLQKRVLFFTIEMKASEVWARLAAVWTGFPGAEIKNAAEMSDDWLARFDAAVKPLAVSPIVVDDDPNLDIADLHQRARREKNSKDGLDLVIVDYAQKVQAREVRHMKTRERVLTVACRLKSLAKEIDVPVVLLSQLSRKAEDRWKGDSGKSPLREPIIGDLSESDAIGQEADTILMVHRPDFYGRQVANVSPLKFSDTTIFVRKNRHGGPGEIQLSFEGATTRFIE